MNNYIIEKMSFNDIDEVIKIQQELNINITSKNSLINDLSDSHYCYFILKAKDNKIIGYAGISTIIDSMDILSIVIAKDFQRLGIGSILLEYLINYARENFKVTILLEVRKTNIPAQKLYGKYGFEMISTRKRYYSDNNEDALIYMLKID